MKNTVRITCSVIPTVFRCFALFSQNARLCSGGPMALVWRISRLPHCRTEPVNRSTGPIYICLHSVLLVITATCLEATVGIYNLL